MKKVNKKLSLSKETVRTLNPRELEGVAGGVYTTQSMSCMASCYSRCWSAGIC